MTEQDDKTLERIEAKLLDALNELFAYRVSLAQAERDPWVLLKEGARRIGKSERATWSRAQKILDCSWVDGGRRKVNLDLLEVQVVPPTSLRRR